MLVVGGLDRLIESRCRSSAKELARKALYDRYRDTYLGA